MEQDLKNLQQEVTLAQMDRLDKWNKDQAHFKNIDEKLKIIDGLITLMTDTINHIQQEAKDSETRLNKRIEDTTLTFNLAPRKVTPTSVPTAWIAPFPEAPKIEKPKFKWFWSN